jgi:hypothetical protein
MLLSCLSVIRMTFQYDNAWELSVSYTDDSWSSLDETDTCPIVGNGKIAVYPSFNLNQGAKSVHITRRAKYDAKSNAVVTFNPFSTWVGSKDAVVTQTKQTLNMLNGVFTTRGHVQVSNVESVDIESDIYVPNHLPFCSVKTIRITPLTNISDLVFHHEISSQLDTVPEYSSSVFYDTVDDRGIPVITAIKSDGSTVVASTYIIDTGLNYTNMGFNVYEAEQHICFNKLLLKGLIGGTTYRIHIVNVHMSIDDYESPFDEAKKIALMCVNKGIDSIRSLHTRVWTAMWNTDISILGKTGITEAQEDKLKEYKRALKTSLYSLYSSSRETVHIGPLDTFGMLDVSGNLLMYGDIFTIPTLLLLKPNLARSVLDYRFNSLKLAKQLAAGYGFKGAKFPYQSEQLGYKNSLYWNTFSNLTYFNTALISINIWNYFRLTKDRAWLAEIGYPVLKENAQFFTDSINGVDILADCCSVETTYDLSLENVVSIAGIESVKNNGFTNNVVRLALRAAIEASYELAYAAPAEWITSRNWLPIPISDDGTNVYKFDDNYDLATAIDGSLPIAETWLNMVPYYTHSSVTANQNQSIAFNGLVNTQDILANIDAYKNKADMSQIMNIALEAVLTGLYMQVDQNYVSVFESTLDTFISATSQGTWKTMNDITIDSMFLFVVLQGLSQLNVKGGTSETRFYYDEMKLNHALSANMPTYWKEVKVAVNKTTQFITKNVIYYI